MDIKYRLYSYPVLAEFNDSYTTGSFEAKALLVKDGFDLAIDVSSTLSDKMLNDFISEGSASLVYHLECASTGYRRIVETDKFETRIPVKSSEVSGELHFCPFILAKIDITNYFNPNFHPDYSQAVKIIKKGCPLAIGKQVNWTISKNNSDLIKSSSPFRILKNADSSVSHMVVEYESAERIKIKLAAKDHALYKYMASDWRLHDVLNSAIVVPALIYVLSQLQKCEPDTMESEFKGLLWYDAIKNTLAQHFDVDIRTINTQNAFELAQRLLKTPINEAFEKLAMFEDDGEEDENDN